MTTTSTDTAALLAHDATEVAKTIAFHVTAGGDFLTAVTFAANEVMEDLIINKGWGFDAARQAAIGFTADVATALGITA